MGQVSVQAKLVSRYVFLVTTTVPKLEKLLDQSLKDARDNSIPLGLE